MELQLTSQFVPIIEEKNVKNREAVLPHVTYPSLPTIIV